MPSLEMQFNLQPLQNLSSHLTHFKNRGFPAAQLNAGNAVKGWIAANFAGRGSLTSGGWPGYKDQTLVNSRLLEKSGRLRQNWHIETNGEALTVKSGVSYALAHHYGTEVLPARPLLPQGETLAELVLPVYTKALTNDLP